MLKYMTYNNLIQNIGSMGNNKSYAENVCYNISMIDLTDNSRIEEFKTEITKAVINLTQNHIEYHIEEFCDCEEFDRTIRLLTNIKIFLENLG